MTENNTVLATAFVASFDNKEGFTRFVQTNAKTLAKAATSREDLQLGLTYAVAHGIIPADGAAAGTWKTHATAQNTKNAEKIADGRVRALATEGKDAKSNVSELNACVRLASVKVGDTNAGVHFLMHYGVRREYAAAGDKGVAYYMLRAIRAAAKLAEDDNELMDEAQFKAVFADKAPQTDAEFWKGVADSIKNARLGSVEKGRKARQDIGDRATKAQELINELALLLSGKGVVNAGKRKEAQKLIQTSGTSQVDQVLQESEAKAGESLASVETKADPDATVKQTIAKGQAAEESIRAETRKMEEAKAKTEKASAKRAAALKNNVTVKSLQDLAELGLTPEVMEAAE